MPRRLLLPLAYGAVALAWSGGWIAGKLGVTAVPPLEFSAIRFAIASVLLLIIARVLGAEIHLRGLRPIVVTALFGYLGYNAFAFVGLTLAPASDAALIVPTTIPVLTALAATLIGERLTEAKIAGFLVASMGAGIVIAAGEDLGVGSSPRLVGDLLLLASAVCWAVYTVLGHVTLRERSPFEVVALATPIGAAMLFPLGFFERGYADVTTWPGGAWLALLYLALVVTCGSFVVYYWVVRQLGAGLAAMTSYLVPVTTLLLAFVILAERPQPLQLAGGAVILAGVRIATLRGAVEPAPELEV